MVSRARPRSPVLPVLLLLLLLFLASLISAQGCSKSNPCATGCCSKHGFCGTTPEHCGEGCQANCDFKLGCDAKNPCKSGCCSKFGFCGMGPDFCAPEVCVAGCDAKYDCDPGDGAEWAKKVKCPLNVCCSKYGFCGMTAEFCGKEMVNHRTCSDDGGLKRVVGYYEGWSTRRPCNTYWPERIPRGVYSHINFAFATIDPQTFEVRPADGRDVELYTRLTALKKTDPGLSVYIALGGWTFNDPGPTATTFSDLARSDDNQRKFFKSLVTFMAMYDFDGVDLDWEYPEAPDRSGRGEDFENFPKFMANLRSELKRTGGRDGVSITLPASYWYLQHFDIVEVRKSVDFFNIMSYDLHGTWDQGNRWTGEYLNPHTNLTEIDAALDLLWRNDIDPGMVVLGLAFYARAYTVVDRNCMEPGCLFASGARKGKCSHEVGILLNSEIDEIVADKDLKPKLYEKEAVKVVHWDDQWLSYDDAETLALKAKYARSMCLGGVMVWAISHDTAEAKYSLALAAATDRRVDKLPMLDGPENIVKIPHPQCMWTNCGEPCPANYQLARRVDHHSRKDEWMLDGSGCNGVGVHRLCCPASSEQPMCGWYDLEDRGGECSPGCMKTQPQWFEVGSNNEYCDTGYQSACCSAYDYHPQTLPSMQLYANCDWAEAPHCDLGKCGIEKLAYMTLVKSSTGSGGAVCLLNEHDERTERRYCCDEQNDKRRWSNCAWHDNLGAAGQGARCWSGCPKDQVRVAMDAFGGRCNGAGSRSYCCDAVNYDEETKYSDEIQGYRDAMEAWAKQPTCPTTRRFAKRDDNRGMDPFGGNTPADKVLALLIAILRTAWQSSLSETDKARRKAWDSSIKTVSDVLVTYALMSFLTDASRYPSFQQEGPEMTAEMILCEPQVYVGLMTRRKTTVICDANLCGIDNLCYDDYDEDSPYSSSQRGFHGATRRDVLMQPGLSPSAMSSLEERSVEQLAFICEDSKGTSKKITWDRHNWPSASEWDAENSIYDNALFFAFKQHCSDTRMNTNIMPDGNEYATEHIIEIHTLPMFFEAAAKGSDCDIDCDFFLKGFKLPIVRNASPLPGGMNSQYPSMRITEALGSSANHQNFVLLSRELNGDKSLAWRLLAMSSEDKWKGHVANDNPRVALQKIRNTISVFNYLNHPYVRPKFKDINRLLREEFRRASMAYHAASNKNIDLRKCWDDWFARHMDEVVVKAKNWVTMAIKDMRGRWDASQNPNDTDWLLICAQVNQHLDRLERLAFTNGEIHFDTSDMY